MNTKLMLCLLCVVLAAGVCLANPLPPYMIASLNAEPAEIGLWSFESLDLSGVVIHTEMGDAVIDDGVYMEENYYGEPFMLDASNTTGLSINPEGDYVVVELLYPAEAGFGQMSRYPAPLEDHPIVNWTFYADGMPVDVLSYDFACPRWGMTDVVINEINAHGAWGNGAGFIEFYNRGEADISLAGWRLICDAIHNFPADAVIPQGGFYVVDEADFPALFDQDFAGDNIYLIDNIAGDNYSGRLVDQVGWSSDHGENVSFMRFPDGDAEEPGSPGYWEDYRGYNDVSSARTFENGFPTRAASNRHDSPGFVVIGARADSVGEGTARIHWTNPIWDDLYDSSVLVKSTDDYPQDVWDGQVIYAGTDQEYVEPFILPDTPNYYTVFAVNSNGGYSTPTEESQAYICFGSVGIKEEPVPEHYATLNCYPNPFNARTTISFSLTKPGAVEISIYDIAGRLVETVADDYYSAGRHSVLWDGEGQASGIYFYRLRTDRISTTRRMVLLK